MALIGSRATARAVAHGDHEFPAIGNGSTRLAYLDKENGVVYKRQRYDFASRGYDNIGEYRIGSRLLRRCIKNDQWITPFVRIPLLSMFSFDHANVIAMQFIDGLIGHNAPHGSIEAHRSLYSLKFGDMHRSNYVLDPDGVLWPVDMGSPRNGRERRPDTRCLHPDDPNRYW